MTDTADRIRASLRQVDGCTSTEMLGALDGVTLRALGVELYSFHLDVMARLRLVGCTARDMDAIELAAIRRPL